MTTPPHTPAPLARGLRNQHLWMLAAVLGVATIHAVVSVVHDTSQRRAAAQLVTRAAAERAAMEGGRRIESSSLRAFAAAIALSGSATSRPDDLVDAVLAAHRAGKACRCVEVLPLQGAFALTTRGEFAARNLTGATGPAGLERDAMLRQLGATALAERRTAGDVGIRLRADSSLGTDVVMLLTLHDAFGAASAVVGLVGDAAATIDQAFGNLAGAEPEALMGEPVLVRLDDRSLAVSGADGRLLFGGLDSTRRFQATVLPSGILSGLTVSAAVATGQIAAPLVAPIASNRVWHLFALMLATIIVIGLAMRASQREASIARARSAFVAGVSHELRMPLAQILLASETLTLRREPSDAERMTLATSILREARRLVGLVENVLLFSRTGSVELRPHLEAVPVDELLADVVEAVELAVIDAGQSIHASPDAGFAVSGDRRLLRQALVNLVDNAMKYGSPGQSIRVIAEQRPGDLVRLVVEDEGRGVPPAERGRVFAPYERLARDQDSVRTGTGLGLAIVRQIADACGGRVWLEDAAAGGTRAVLELPAPARDGAVAVV